MMNFIKWLFGLPLPDEYYKVPCANNRLIFDLKSTSISINYDNPEVLKGIQKSMNKYITADLTKNKTHNKSLS